MRHFRSWVDYHWGVTRTTLAARGGNAFKVSLQIASRRAKSKESDSTAVLERMLKAGSAKRKEEEEEEGSRLPSNVEASFTRMAAFCKNISEEETVRVGAFAFSPR